MSDPEKKHSFLDTWTFRSLGLLALVIAVLGAWRLWSPYSLPKVVELLSQSIGEGAAELWVEPYFRLGNLAVTPSLLFKTFVFIVILLVLARLVQRVTRRTLARTTFEKGTAFALERGAGYVFFVFGIVLGIQSAGLDLSTLAVFGGAVGIGLGFGLQNIAKNFASGLVLLIERPIKVGDRVEVGELVGDVTHIGGRGTWIRTNDNVVMIVPNSEFVEQRVTNWTANDRQIRIHVPVGVSYDSDPEVVARILIETALANTHVLKSPSPDVIFTGFGESSLDFALRAWTITQVRTPPVLRSQLYYAIFAAFRSEGITIPFPQRDLHLRSADSDDGMREKWLPGQDSNLQHPG